MTDENLAPGYIAAKTDTPHPKVFDGFDQLLHRARQASSSQMISMVRKLPKPCRNSGAAGSRHRKNEALNPSEA